jgi:carbamoyltransferase
VLAGGVALNCVSNGNLLKNGPFKNIWIQPAAGDQGCSLGAALYAHFSSLNKERNLTNNHDSMKGGYLGPSFENQEIINYLDSINAIYEEFTEEVLVKKTAEMIDNEKVIGWFQGRMEFGPRALGSRSIIGDPRSLGMQSKMNLKIKYRESFRPFAPSVLDEDTKKYFDIKQSSPYMLLVSEIQENYKVAIPEDQKNLEGLEKLKQVRSKLTAITHVNYSARVHSVSHKTNSRYYKLLKAFKELTDCSVMINTSFNVRGEPIVCSPEDAYRCFMRTEMDALVIGNFILHKEAQPHFVDKTSWQTEYDLD